MTRTTPLRRMILHFLQIGFIDGRTFIFVVPMREFWDKLMPEPALTT
jgi:hypothetical protein